MAQAHDPTTIFQVSVSCYRHQIQSFLVDKKLVVYRSSSHLFALILFDTLSVRVGFQTLFRNTVDLQVHNIHRVSGLYFFAFLHFCIFAQDTASVGKQDDSAAGVCALREPRASRQRRTQKATVSPENGPLRTPPDQTPSLGR